MSITPGQSGGLDALIAFAQARPWSPGCEHFYFLRHGQTPRNALKIFQGYDEPLSELGQQQARDAAAALAGEHIASIVASTARRAFDTALTVAAPHTLAPIASDALRERFFGALIGTSSAHIDWAVTPEGGETLAQFVDRTRAALIDALRAPGPVLVVAHGGTLYVLAALLGVPLNLGLMGNAQPLRFTRQGNGWTAQPLLAAGGDASLA
jgi:broad specificity phosphatase PhoE